MKKFRVTVCVDLEVDATDEIQAGFYAVEVVGVNGDSSTIVNEVRVEENSIEEVK